MGVIAALVPARKGSKRVPRKNIRGLLGKPLVEYTLDHAYKVTSFDVIAVTTDDEEIVQIAKRYGATIIHRPPDLCTTDAKMVDVINHSLQNMQERGIEVDILFLLQPTSPIRLISKTEEAILIMRNTNCDSVVSLVEVDHFHPNRMKRLIGDRVVSYTEKEVENVHMEDLPQAYHRDGSIYGMRVNLPLGKRTIYGEDVRGIVNDVKWFVNIDTERDWDIAEILVENYYANKPQS